jgi:hypothetical protein
LTDKSKWRVVLVFLLAASLLLGASLAALAEDAPDKPTECPNPDPVLGSTLPSDWFGPQGGFDNIGAGDIRPDKLPNLEDCETLGYLKINLDQNNLVTGWYQYGMTEVYGTDDGFKVYIWNDGDSFTWLSNYPVYYVYAKGGAQMVVIYMNMIPLRIMTAVCSSLVVVGAT